MNSSDRRGMIALITMAALLLASAVTMTIVQSVLLQQRALEQRQLTAQVDLLAQSAFDRAAALLAARQGEKLTSGWQPVVDQGRQNAEISFIVRDGSQPDRKLVTIVAILTNGGTTSVRSTMTGEVSVPTD